MIDPMDTTLAFDVYGTLIDPLGMSSELGKLIGKSGPVFASAWRDKQIEYLFRRGLGRDYVSFSSCTRQALDYTCQATGNDLSTGHREALMACYKDLPAYPGAAVALAHLKEAGFSNYAFSNGDPEDLATLFRNAGLESSLDGVVSVQSVRSFKPDPAVYAHFCAVAESKPEDTWLISGNPFDVIGAAKCGWRTAWVRRNPAQLFDPWDCGPTVIVDDLSELLAVIG